MAGKQRMATHDRLAGPRTLSARLVTRLACMLFLSTACVLLAGPRAAHAQRIESVVVKGNAQVESDAVVTLLESQAGTQLDKHKVRSDIRKLHELGFFSDIRFKERTGKKGGIVLVVEVVEKPAIVEIVIEGNDEITEETLREKLATKLYTIVNENTITQDVRAIEQQYAEKGFFLASVGYDLVEVSPKEVKVTFRIDEGGKVQVAEVQILGNKYFSDSEVINRAQFATRPYTRGEAISQSSLYNKEFIQRDAGAMEYLYKDNGFAEVKVGKPVVEIDSNRDFVRATFKVEEGLQYNIGKIDVTGDLLFPKPELLEAMRLKPGDLFRYSLFVKDVEMLTDKYGDLGYAYADPAPDMKFNKEARTVDITYVITKGEKVYFGEITIVGNSKTRDNVVRREMEVADAALYSGTGLTQSKANINRLGFFEEIQVIKERVDGRTDELDLKVKVKERPTGQLQAAVGFTPSTGNQQSSWFGQGRYSEENQSGKGWQTNLAAKWNGQETYSFELGFTEPRINDGDWSAGVTGFYRNEVRRIIEDVNVEERRLGAQFTLGRRIIEQIRASIAYRIERLQQVSDVFVLRAFRDEGITSSLIFSLRRNATDNYLEPTDGSDVLLRHVVAGGPGLGGDFSFYESSADVNYFYPIDFSDTYRTYFRIHSQIAYIYQNPATGDEVPFVNRYRLGGYDDMRGYEFQEISPEYSVMRAPGGALYDFPKGGDKQLYAQLEYYVPLIPEARIKALVFTDIGRVYDNDEAIALKDFKRDVGFGFRWITPIAPFRFEWAYPLEKGGELGDMQIIFSLGY